MSECYSARCQYDRKLIRREFNKWTKNILLQIGLETISKNHFKYDINSFNQINDEQIPIDFNPNETCLFCINRQEYISNKKLHSNKTNFSLNEDTDDENSPLDLSLKTTNLKSDIFPNYNPEELFLSSQMNFDYLSQIYPNMNLFSSLLIDQYQTNSSSIDDSYIAQLAKQMAYLRMIQEIEQQRTNKKSKITTNVSNTSSTSILTESMHINHVINDIMMRTLNEIFEEQIKQQQQQQQQTRASRQGELLFVKKQNHNNDDITIINTKKQHKHTNPINQSSSSSYISSLPSRCSPLIHTKTKLKSKSNQSSTPVSSRRSKEIISNNMDGKQIRPKRGQYRRYESEQLAKAVAAVLSNEMSVHKAGSYFGVPHSTLEYKVKERNSKMSTTMKNTNELSVNDSNDDNDKLSIHSRTKSDGEEIQTNISIELEMN